ncbi:radical SAM protein [Clostridium sp. LBM24168]
MDAAATVQSLAIFGPLMKEHGFLVDKDIDEYKRLKIAGDMQRYNTQNFGLTIAPTINCNMECPYCYEEKSNKRMSEDVQNGLINYIEKNIIHSNIKSFHTTWYGGEPLLEKDLILNLSRKFIKLTNDNGIRYSASIVTNGSLLDYNTAKMLKEECYINFAQITIDGLGNIHNNRRKLKNGQNSFNLITNNINNCKELINIPIRVNVDRTNIYDTKNLIKYFIDERKWTDDTVT